MPSSRSNRFSVLSPQFSVEENRVDLHAICSGRLLRSAYAFAGRALLSPACARGLRRTLFLSLAVPLFAIPQTNHQQPAKKGTATRINELTLAGLRPGRSTRTEALQLYKGREFGSPKASPADQLVFQDQCRDLALAMDLDARRTIQVIRVGFYCCSTVDCFVAQPSPWKTGQGLAIGDSPEKTAQIYGQPDSKSPSTQNGQPLELWYYAFDWAGPDVPQVMEVLCTREKDGQPGRVIEITLAAPSL